MLIAIKLIALTSVSVHLFEIRTQKYFTSVYIIAVLWWLNGNVAEEEKEGEMTILPFWIPGERIFLTCKQASKQRTVSTAKYEEAKH